ncbi:MAG TPA: D-alanyl-D-alanine carboxypeptidase, partial [Gemmatimonadales bacterium]|nr:D-alanyl-D-alanine carboxypeptidase [Gemmatimonadales bacterium]
MDLDPARSMTRRATGWVSLAALAAAFTALPAARAAAQASGPDGTGAAVIAAPAAASPELAEQLDAWSRAAARAAPGHWGVAVADESGRTIWSLDADNALVPASATKIFTTGFARSVLGGTARRPTRVVGAGAVDPLTGTWLGSWGLELNGDPSLERESGAGPMLYDLAMQLASTGVRKLRGPLVVQTADGPA